MVYLLFTCILILFLFLYSFFILRNIHLCYVFQHLISVCTICLCPGYGTVSINWITKAIPSSKNSAYVITDALIEKTKSKIWAVNLQAVKFYLILSLVIGLAFICSLFVPMYRKLTYFICRWGGLAVRLCRGVLPIWILVGQGLAVLSVGASGNCSDIFSLVYYFISSLFLYLPSCGRGTGNRAVRDSPI